MKQTLRSFFSKINSGFKVKQRILFGIVCFIIVLLYILHLFIGYAYREKIRFNQIIIAGKNELTDELTLKSDTVHDKKFTLKQQNIPKFVGNVNQANDLTIPLRYESEYAETNGTLNHFVTNGDGVLHMYLSGNKGNNRYLLRNANIKDHTFDGSPIYLSTNDRGYSVEYIGLNINDTKLIQDLSIVFASDCSVDESGNGDCDYKNNITVLGNVGLELVGEEDSVYWYKLGKSVLLRDKSNTVCSDMNYYQPSFCHYWDSDPKECEKYYCYYGLTTETLKNGRLRFNLAFKETEKKGFIKAQVVNIIFKGSDDKYYQPIIGGGPNNYYKAYINK